MLEKLIYKARSVNIFISNLKKVHIKNVGFMLSRCCTDYKYYPQAKVCKRKQLVWVHYLHNYLNFFNEQSMNDEHWRVQNCLKILFEYHCQFIKLIKHA